MDVVEILLAKKLAGGGGVGGGGLPLGVADSSFTLANIGLSWTNSAGGNE